MYQIEFQLQSGGHGQKAIEKERKICNMKIVNNIQKAVEQFSAYAEANSLISFEKWYE